MSSKKKAYPSKITLNLVIKDRPAYYARALLLGILIGIIVIGAFAKFAVIDRLAAASKLEREAAAKQAQYEQLVSDNAVFADVRSEYEKYFKDVDGEAGFADCMDTISLIEKTLMTVGNLQSATLSNNVLSVVLTDISLEEASSIVKALYLNEMVSSVSLPSAEAAVDGAPPSVSLSITLIAMGGNPA